MNYQIAIMPGCNHSMVRVAWCTVLRRGAPDWRTSARLAAWRTLRCVAHLARLAPRTFRVCAHTNHHTCHQNEQQRNTNNERRAMGGERREANDKRRVEKRQATKHHN